VIISQRVEFLLFRNVGRKQSKSPSAFPISRDFSFLLRLRIMWVRQQENLLSHVRFFLVALLIIIYKDDRSFASESLTTKFNAYAIYTLFLLFATCNSKCTSRLLSSKPFAFIYFFSVAVAVILLLFERLLRRPFDFSRYF
jgi:hypothetical protein